jgi:16S rRNA (guanine1207-N2)-methyltransferase
MRITFVSLPGGAEGVPSPPEVDCRVQGDDHHALHRVDLGGRALTLKSGVRGFPDLAPGADLLLEGATLAEVDGAVDATGSAGAIALGLQERAASWRVLEPSSAALRCAAATFAAAEVGVGPGLIWDLAGAGVDAVMLLPPGDRGSARVEAELAGAAAALRPGGVAYLAMHRDRGAKRYERRAAELFGRAEVVARSGGWRLTRATRIGDPDAPDLWRPFEAAGMTLTSLPGVFASGRLDAGTAALLDELPLGELTGRRVLDLGCGYGALALTAARAGAEVVAVDDDLAAVRSARRNAERLGLAVDVRHSDVTAELAAERRFDLVLSNPPFHVGAGVRLSLPRTFIAEALARLVPGGELLLVANRALPYEAEMAAWGSVETLSDRGGYKVLRGRRYR